MVAVVVVGVKGGKEQRLLKRERERDGQRRVYLKEVEAKQTKHLRDKTVIPKRCLEQVGL